MTLSETTIGAITRALLNDRKALSKSLVFWSAPGPAKLLAGQHVHAIDRDLRENASALVELANNLAPWLKQHPDWQAIANYKPLTTKEPT
jgi:FPC/CPF motif-containing protein YcgG